MREQLEKENTLDKTLSDDKNRVWISKTQKVNYDEFYKVMAQIHKAM